MIPHIDVEQPLARLKLALIKIVISAVFNLTNSACFSLSVPQSDSLSVYLSCLLQLCVSDCVFVCGGRALANVTDDMTTKCGQKRKTESMLEQRAIKIILAKSNTPNCWTNIWWLIETPPGFMFQFILVFLYVFFSFLLHSQGPSWLIFNCAVFFLFLYFIFLWFLHLFFTVSASFF